MVGHGAIEHALRFTVSRTRRDYPAPARHSASSSTSLVRRPMGVRVRLKASDAGASVAHGVGVAPEQAHAFPSTAALPFATGDTFATPDQRRAIPFPTG